MFKLITIALGILLLVACGDQNTHFCAKYSYYYKQLEVPGLPPYSDMKKALQKEIVEGNENSKIALFVLEDFQRSNKPKKESPEAFCIRRELWLRYRH